MSVVLNGNTYATSDFVGSDGRGYSETFPATGLQLFPESIFTDLIAELASATSIDGVSPGAAGGILVSDGSDWVRAGDATITDAGEASFTTGAFSDILTVSDETDTTGSGTGALRVAGGADVAKNLWVGGTQIRLANTSAAPSIIVNGMGGVTSEWQTGSGSVVKFGSTTNHALKFQTNNLFRMTIAAGGDVTIDNNLTVSGTGASSVAGNLTVSKATYRANSGGYYWSAQGTAAVGTQGVYVKVSAASSTTSFRAENFTIDTNNRATYTGTSTQTFRVTYIVTMTAETASRIYGLRIAKTGTDIVGSTIHRKIGTIPGDEGAVMVEYFVELATNDYVELFATDTEGTADVMVEHGTCTITEA